MSVIKYIVNRLKSPQKPDEKISEDTREVTSFQVREFPKIPRLNRDILITEKIDGCNVAIGITDTGSIYAQSRNSIITSDRDHFGFAGWVETNKEILKFLGPGIHFGEWWGVGINRGYGIHERRFSLFNIMRWRKTETGKTVIEEIQKYLPNVALVPVLYEGPWFTKDEHDSVPEYTPDSSIEWLKRKGSCAAPNYMKPEGIVVYHKASDYLFKVTCERDQEWKGKQDSVKN